MIRQILMMCALVHSDPYKFQPLKNGKLKDRFCVKPQMDSHEVTVPKPPCAKAT